jgi:hypothetical protein
MKTATFEDRILGAWMFAILGMLLLGCGFLAVLAKVAGVY